jgi:DNA (cytosine-5)-methyltransferase 1
LSNAGKGLGMEKGSGTRSGLLWEVERLLDECKELPQVLLMENVPAVVGKKNKEVFSMWTDKLESLGYKNQWKILNAKDFGIPQNRERCFMVSILGDYFYEFPKTIPLTLRLKDMLETTVEEKYYLSDSMLDYIVSKDDKYKVNENSLVINRDIACTINTRVGSTRADASDFICESLPDNYNLIKNKCNCVGTLKGGKWDKMHDIAKRVYSPNGCSPTIHTCGGGNLERKIVEPIAYDEQNQYLRTDGCVGTLTTDGSSPKHNNRVIEPNHRIRKLTPKECWRLMGFEDTDIDKAIKIGMSNAQLYKQSGNSIVVQVLENIFKEML